MSQEDRGMTHAKLLQKLGLPISVNSVKPAPTIPFGTSLISEKDNRLEKSSTAIKGILKNSSASQSVSKVQFAIVSENSPPPRTFTTTPLPRSGGPFSQPGGLFYSSTQKQAVDPHKQKADDSLQMPLILKGDHPLQQQQQQQQQQQHLPQFSSTDQISSIPYNDDSFAILSRVEAILNTNSSGLLKQLDFPLSKQLPNDLYSTYSQGNSKIKRSSSLQSKSDTSRSIMKQKLMDSKDYLSKLESKILRKEQSETHSIQASMRNASSKRSQRLKMNSVSEEVEEDSSSNSSSCTSSSPSSRGSSLKNKVSKLAQQSKKAHLNNSRTVRSENPATNPSWNLQQLSEAPLPDQMKGFTQIQIFCINCDDYIELSKVDDHSVFCAGKEQSKASPAFSHSNSDHMQRHTIEKLNEKLFKIKIHIQELVVSDKITDAEKFLQVQGFLVDTGVLILSNKAEEVNLGIADLRVISKKVAKLEQLQNKHLAYSFLVLLGKFIELAKKKVKILTLLPSTNFLQNQHSAQHLQLPLSQKDAYSQQDDFSDWDSVCPGKPKTQQEVRSPQNKQESVNQLRRANQASKTTTQRIFAISSETTPAQYNLSTRSPQASANIQRFPTQSAAVAVPFRIQQPSVCSTTNIQAGFEESRFQKLKNEFFRQASNLKLEQGDNNLSFKNILISDHFEKFLERHQTVDSIPLYFNQFLFLKK